MIESKEYVGKALKTAVDLGSPVANLTHAILGLCDESMELFDAAPASANELEELGDLLWFCALAGSVIKAESQIDVWEQAALNPLKTESHTSTFDLIVEQSCTAAGLIKKPFAYGQSKPIPYKEIAAVVSTIISAVERIAIARNWSLEIIQNANIAKLNKRYKGGGFDSTNAFERDTAAEIAAITQGK